LNFLIRKESPTVDKQKKSIFVPISKEKPAATIQFEELDLENNTQNRVSPMMPSLESFATKKSGKV
jgi:hypothetical protein